MLVAIDYLTRYLLVTLKRLETTRWRTPFRRFPETLSSFREASSQSTIIILPGSSTGAASPPARSTAAVFLYLAAYGSMQCGRLIDVGISIFFTRQYSKKRWWHYLPANNENNRR